MTSWKRYCIMFLVVYYKPSMAKGAWKITMSCWRHMETSATHSLKPWILMDAIAAPWAAW